ncbi:MAG: FAD-binding oxidoreductase [Xenococcaceae cyanobacterium MO_234.B1]|nr:FAD-binding oxidoreductase [Xenococcaceae cyanobacterium MO_234.B1]
MSVTNIKIKAVNGETGEFKEKLLTLATVGQRECLLGRHPSCDLVLDSAEVSRIHGRIWCQDGQCFFTDLGSTDGSQIDAQEVEINQVYPLNPNNLLRIGGFVLTLSQMSSEENISQLQPTAEPDAPSQPRQWSSGELTVRCLQAIAETQDVKTFRFVAEPTVLFSYKPGQFVTLDLEIEGKRVMRSYSISSTPSRPHILEITVKRVPPPTDVADAPPGLVSNWLHDYLTVGSQVKLKGPMGNFTCADNQAQKLLFISAGSGITPMMSMSRWLCDTGANVDVVFIHSARSPRDVIFRQELESMAARHTNFKLAVTTTRSEPGQAWVRYTGRLNEVMLQAIAPDFRSRTVYVCGPNPFMEGVKTMLETLLFPMENYHQESFGSPKRKRSVKEKREDGVTKVGEAEGCREEDSSPKSAPNQEHPPETAQEEPENVTSVKTTQEQSPVVVFAKVGKEIACDEEDTILDLAEQEGIELPSGCRMGACGACKLALLEGEVNYDDDPDCEPGHLLTCIAKPVGRVVIEA